MTAYESTRSRDAVITSSFLAVRNANTLLTQSATSVHGAHSQRVSALRNANLESRDMIFRSGGAGRFRATFGADERHGSGRACPEAAANASAGGGRRRHAPSRLVVWTEASRTVWWARKMILHIDWFAKSAVPSGRETAAGGRRGWVGGGSWGWSALTSAVGPFSAAAAHSFRRSNCKLTAKIDAQKIHTLVLL